MAFAIIQVGLKHLGDRHRIHLLEEVNKTMKLIHYEDERYWIEQKEIEDQERPRLNSVREDFLARHRGGEPAEQTPFSAAGIAQGRIITTMRRGYAALILLALIWG